MFEHSILKQEIEDAIERAYKTGFTADKTGQLVHLETPDEYASRRAAMYRQSIEIPNPAQGELPFPTDGLISKRYWQGYRAGISACEGVVIKHALFHHLDEATLTVVKRIENGIQNIPTP